METTETLFKDFEIETTKRFSCEELKTFTSDFSKSLGSGAFGDVYKGVLISTGKQVAVKVLKGGLLFDGMKDQFKAEVSVLCNIHHKNVVKLYGFCFEHNMKALVYEFMENKSLDKLLFGNQRIEWEILCNIAIGAAKGLSYLHEGCQPSIIHYDVKPANILLDSNFFPKVGDFGLAKRLIDEKTHIIESRIRGTVNYIAPELHQRFSSITNKCDVYSFGMMLFDIIGRRRVSAEWGPIHVWKMFDKKREEKIMEECGIRENDRELATRILLIALWCVQHTPGDRPSMSRVVTLLDCGEVIKMPPNPFWFLDFSSTTGFECPTLMKLGSKRVSLRTNHNSTPSRSSFLPIEVGGVSKRKFRKPYKVKEDDRDNIMKSIRVGPWGGPGGINWDDGVYPGVKQIQEDDRDNIMESICVGPWGGLGGINWDDGVYSGVKQIQVFRERRKICAIQIEYSGKNGESIWSERHGTSGAPTINKIKFDYPREILVRVSGFYYRSPEWEYSLLRSLSFFTNKNKYGPFGEEKGVYFSSWKDGKDGKVVGFHGRCGAFLDAIGLQMQ